MPQPRHARFTAPAPPRDTEPLDGILPIDKPPGPTSHDVVDMIRRKLGIRKVGHGGTLDPAATGVLVILTGRGTKLSSRFMTSDKTYEGTICLGAATNSQDADGEIISEAPWDHITREQLEAEMATFKGDQYQTPPMVSAVKVDGVPLYKHARKGKTVERKPRFIHIYDLTLLDFEPPTARFVMRCTKGTYVRTVCADIGEALGCGAHLQALRRTVSGTIDLGQTTPLKELLDMSEEEVIERIVPIRHFAA